MRSEQKVSARRLYTWAIDFYIRRRRRWRNSAREIGKWTDSVLCAEVMVGTPPNEKRNQK